MRKCALKDLNPSVPCLVRTLTGAVRSVACNAVPNAAAQMKTVPASSPARIVNPAGYPERLR